jgi:hypothetical protein
MGDLLDIAPSTAVQSVWVDGTRIVVRGLHGDAIASILARFPDLHVFLGGSFSGNVAARLVAQCGSAIGPVIAAGCGHLGDETYEKHASSMMVEHQLMLLQPILGLTFPNGFVAFIAKITGLLMGEGERPITVRVRRSPSPSQPLSEPDSHQTMQ